MGVQQAFEGKSLKYSSGNWLYDYDTQEPYQDTPVLHNSNWGLGRHKDRYVPDMVSKGIEAFLGGVQLMFSMTLWVHSNHQDTPFLHNSNWGGIGTGRFLTGF